MTKVCIFDFDGVIVDTEKYHFMAWQRACKGIGITITYDQYEPLKSTGRDHILHNLLSSTAVYSTMTTQQQNELKQQKGIEYDKLIIQLSKQDILPGFEQFARYLLANGCRLAVASASVKARQLIELFSLGGYFDYIVDGKDNLQPKPAPDMFQKCQHALGAQKEDCLVFEDSRVGIQASTNANIKSIYVGQQLYGDALFAITDFTAQHLYEYIDTQYLSK